PQHGRTSRHVGRHRTENAGPRLLSVVRMIPPERLLDTYLAAKRELQPYERSTDYWTASSLGMCLRRQYLERKGVTPLVTPDARALRRFATGDVFHDFIQSMYADCGQAVGIEVPVKDHDRQLS